jgi:hypothetical protein
MAPSQPQRSSYAARRVVGLRRRTLCSDEPPLARRSYGDGHRGRPAMKLHRHWRSLSPAGTRSASDGRNTLCKARANLPSPQILRNHQRFRGQWPRRCRRGCALLLNRRAFGIKIVHCNVRLGECGRRCFSDGATVALLYISSLAHGFAAATQGMHPIATQKAACGVVAPRIVVGSKTAPSQKRSGPMAMGDGRASSIQAAPWLPSGLESMSGTEAPTAAAALA